jgi:tRNA-splicing ligase RtcB
LSNADLDGVLQQGARWAVDRGYGRADDLAHIEEGGALPGAVPALVSDRARERGQAQLGTLGSGNHFAELQYVAEIYDERVAAAFGLERDQIVAMIHSGSRGLGHQVCEDYLRVMIRAAQKYGIELPDRQLCCAPLKSPEGREYLAAMSAAANFAFANRQVMAHWVRESMADALGMPADALGVRTVYDVCHNIANSNDSQPARCVCTARALRAPTRQDIRRRPRPIARSASRCSFRATWADIPTSSLERKVRTGTRSGRRVTAPAGAGAARTRSGRPGVRK